MGRMHGAGNGKSQSVIPYRRSPPTWLKVTADEVEDKIVKLARKGYTPSQIGAILRDSDGIGRVKSVTGKKILRMLKSNGLAPDGGTKGAREDEPIAKAMGDGNERNTAGAARKRGTPGRDQVTQTA